MTDVTNRTKSLAPARRLAWIAVFWERLWPLMLPALGVIALFLIISWLGLWPGLSDVVRIGALIAMGAGFLASLLPLRHMRLPSSSEIDTRIERRSELAHRPVTAQVDVPADVAGGDDPFAQALWREHQSRMADKLSNLKSGTPSPQVARRDPYALRAVVGLFLFVAVAAGWGNLSERIGDAFRSHAQIAAPVGRIDAWVTPPAYTNKPPIFLSKVGQAPIDAVTVPEGSELVVRVLKLDEPSLTLAGDKQEQSVEEEKKDKAQENGKEASAAKPADQSVKSRSVTYKIALSQSTVATLRSGDSEAASWSFTVLPDADPSIAFEDGPSTSTRGALEFSYRVEDDYGVASARAEIESLSAPKATARPLVEAPEMALPLPSRRARQGVTKTSRDLTNHPWAGARVTLKLVAEDEAGQTGESETKTLTLPERIFTKPLARAIVSERRKLALDARSAKQVAEMLDIITTTHPDEFIKDVAVYTGLRVAYRSIRRAKNDDELRENLDLLWEIALSVEDGDLSLAERRLRDAQERLNQALENGASDEEISSLMQELRQAMNEFMQELAEQMSKNPQNQQAMPLDPNAQVLRQQDLDRLMKQIEDLAKSGSRDAARQLLQELQRMMNNLQTAQPGQRQQQQTDQFSEQMNQLGEIMRQQQQLMDQTFDMQRQQQGQQQGQQNQQGQQPGDRQPGQRNQQGQNGQQQGQQGQQGQRPMTPEEFAEALKQLQQQQGELQQRMQELQQSMRDLGLEPGKLGEAGEAMGGAEQRLGESQTGEAVGEQGRALQAMREGAQQMMQNMQNQAGEQGRRGERGQHGEQSRNDRDPLGRQSRSQGPQLGDDVKVPGEIDAQRAREILDAIRRRLSDPSRPRLELDYLDRLLPTR